MDSIRNGVDRVINTVVEHAKGNISQKGGSVETSQIMRSLMRELPQVREGMIENKNARIAANAVIISTLGLGFLALNVGTAFAPLAGMALGVITAKALLMAKEKFGKMAENSVKSPEKNDSPQSAKPGTFSKDDIFNLFSRDEHKFDNKELGSINEKINQIKELDPKFRSLNEIKSLISDVNRKINTEPNIALFYKDLAALMENTGELLMKMERNDLRSELKNECDKISTKALILGSENTLNEHIKFSENKNEAIKNLSDRFIPGDKFIDATEDCKVALDKCQEARNRNDNVGTTLPKSIFNFNSSMVDCGEKLCKYLEEKKPDSNILSEAKEQLSILKNNNQENEKVNYAQFAGAVQLLSDIANKEMGDPQINHPKMSSAAINAQIRKASVTMASAGKTPPPIGPNAQKPPEAPTTTHENDTAKLDEKTSELPTNMQSIQEEKKNESTPDSNTTNTSYMKARLENARAQNPQYKRPAPKSDGETTGLPSNMQSP